MATSTIFSLPLREYQTPAPLRRRTNTKKRKRGSQTDDIDDNFLSQPSDTEASTKNNTTDTDTDTDLDTDAENLTLSPSTHAQYLAAGHPLHKPIPPHPFPLNTTTTSTNKHSHPTPKSPTHYRRQKLTLHQHHLINLNTILHRCLLQGDYLRAGRAWGLLLRSAGSGNSNGNGNGQEAIADVRVGGRWGIGGEILLRREEALREQQQQDDAEGDGENRSGGIEKKWFTRAGFEAAREYYSRLAILYPVRKGDVRSGSGSGSGSDSARSNAFDFQLAMFGLWIWVVCEESKDMRGRDVDEGEDGNSDDDDEDQNVDIDMDLQDPGDFYERQRRREKRRDQIAREREYLAAVQIRAEIDALIAGPPWDQFGDLLRLRAMVEFWIGDLEVWKLGFEIDVEEEDDDDDENEHEESEESASPTPRRSRKSYREQPKATIEERMARTRREEIHQVARDFLDRAADAGVSRARSTSTDLAWVMSNAKIHSRVGTPTRREKGKGRMRDESDE